jgi:hypothetical protein
LKGRRRRGQEQPERPPFDDVEAAPARREIAERGPRVSRLRERLRVGLEERPRELRVAAARGDLNEPRREDALDFAPVAEGRALLAHGEERADEDGPRQLVDHRADARDGRRLLVFRARAEPRVHVRDRLVRAMRRERARRELFFEDRPHERIDALAHEGPQESERRFGISREADAARARDREEIASRSGWDVLHSIELRVGRRHRAVSHGFDRQRDLGHRNEAVLRELGEEALEPGSQADAQDDVVRAVRVLPRFANAFERRRGRRRRREGRDGLRGRAAPAARRCQDERCERCERKRQRPARRASCPPSVRHALPCLPRSPCPSPALTSRNATLLVCSWRRGCGRRSRSPASFPSARSSSRTSR